MPVIHFKDKVISCKLGANLREVLLQHGLAPHNGNSKYLNCRGLGTCGTCAVKVVGPTNAPTSTEKLRLLLPPHQPANGLRLACQVKVMGDLVVTKGEGFWGQYPPA